MNEPLIPKHKNDTNTIELLYDVEDSILHSVVDKVLEWMADLNWPIAKDVRDLVIVKQDVFSSAMLCVFEGNDKEVKYALVTNVIEDLTPSNIKTLNEILYRIYANPKKMEVKSGVWQELRDLIEIEKTIELKK